MEQAQVTVSKPGRGGARRRSEAAVLTCAACAGEFEHWRCGRLPRLCVPCGTTLRYCPKCESVKPLADFYASQGPGSQCRDCCSRAREYDCAACGETFIRSSRGGKTTQSLRMHLCDGCEQGLKWCPSCGLVRKLTAFPSSAGKRNGRSASCSDCRRIAHAARSERDRLRVVVRRYGITVAEWDAMYVSQGGLCASCGNPPAPESRGLVVDHDHTTGRVRSLLCSPCNVGLGHFADDPDRLRKAAEYIERERRVAR